MRSIYYLFSLNADGSRLRNMDSPVFLEAFDPSIF